MTLIHKKGTGATTIRLDWTETRQLASGYGLEALREAVQQVVRLTQNFQKIVDQDSENKTE